MLKRSVFFLSIIRALLPEEVIKSYYHLPPPSPVKMQLELHVCKWDEAIGICLVLGKVLGPLVGSFGGRGAQCWAMGI